MRSPASRLLAATIAAAIGATSLPSFAQIVPGVMDGGGGAATSDATNPQGSGYNANGAPASLPSTPTITNSPLDPSGLQRQMDSQQRNSNNSRQPKGTPKLTRPLEENEFQRFVFNATGQRLSLFGQHYFDQQDPTSGQQNDPNATTGAAQNGTSNFADRTFTAADRVPVPADYVLGPGDELYIRAWGSIDVDYRATVDRNGQINLPKVGTIGVAGLKANEVESHINSQISRVYRNFSLNVTLGQLRSIQVFVVGQARNPGTYTVSSLSTLVNVVFASGGPGANGSMRRVQLKRAGKAIADLDLYDFLIEGSKAQDQRLLPGDVIVYTAAGPRVALLGSLDTPAIYELKAEGESIATVLNYGGGTRASTNLKTAQLERIDSGQPKAPRSVTTLDLANAGQTTLRDGDVVTFFAVAPQFSNAVTLRGNVAAPLRYPYAAGMKISDLIPSRDALITPEYYTRKNRLVQFMEPKRSPAKTPGTLDIEKDPSRSVSADELSVNVKNILDEPNWDYAAVERLNPATLVVEAIPFNLGKAVLDRDPANDLALQSGDVVTIFGRKDIRSPVSKQTRLVRVEGEVGAPGVYQVGPDDTLIKVLSKAGGLTPQAYVYGIEFSREETRRKQQQALEEATRRLEIELANAGATQAANLTATNDKSAEVLQAAQLAASRAQLAKLRSLKASGRISLELEPSLNGSASTLPDIRLEDGDRLLVPPTPSYVFAVGAVANSNALLWRKDRKLSAYLDVAGVEADADMGNIFVVRADGSVVHSSRRGWFSNIEKLELMPGDTIVIPGKTNRETFWTGFVRGLKDWSQILYQFGLTAAAIQTLRN